jgi:xanthine dehydrogenase accessory factor
MRIMDSVDIEVLRTAINWHQDAMCVAIATVTKTWGSAPRPVGAMLALRADGLLKGSVSGGCIEDDLSLRARNGQLDFQRTHTVKYGVSTDEARRFGLPCGGTLELVIEPLREAAKFQDVFRAIQEGETVLRTVDTLTGIATLRRVAIPTHMMFDGRHLETVHGPELRLVLIGAGQLSEYVARMAIPLGYKVIVCDPREEYLATWNVTNAELSRDMPDDLLIDLNVDCNTAILALSHDPKLDDMALLEALKSEAFYVGAIGSRANSMQRKVRLKLFDLSDREVERLHAPVGLYIGAQTTPEIAVAILGEMTAVRRNVAVLQGHASRPPRDAASNKVRL